MLLREFSDVDADGLFQLNKDPDVIRYTGDGPFKSIAEAQSFIACYGKYREDGYGRWSLLMKSSEEFIGWCGLSRDNVTMETDLGFRLMKRMWNKGLATEAAGASLTYGIKHVNLKRIIGRARVENFASIRVLEEIGMSFEFNFQKNDGWYSQYVANNL